MPLEKMCFPTSSGRMKYLILLLVVVILYVVTMSMTDYRLLSIRRISETPGLNPSHLETHIWSFLVGEDLNSSSDSPQTFELLTGHGAHWPEDKISRQLKPYVNGYGKLRKPLSEKTIVIILAYMRTGSTLTGSLFQEYPGSFYVFEPIRYLHEKFQDLVGSNRSHVTLKYLYSRSRNYTLAARDLVILEEINNWLTCGLDKISVQSLTDEFHHKFTTQMKDFVHCARTAISEEGKYDSINIDDCLDAAISSCQRAPVIILKFIRLKMAEVFELLPRYPNLKIIHLVRDPRGIMNSRIELDKRYQSFFKKDVDMLCSKMFDNLKYSKYVLQTYPNRLKTVYYEDLAEKPMETAREILEFAGLHFTKQLQTFIQNQTSSSKDSCAYCTQRKDSRVTATRWKTQLDVKLSDYISEACRTSNTILGYVPLPSAASRIDMHTKSRLVTNINKKLMDYNGF